jgi:hypothetical protein
LALFLDTSLAEPECVAVALGCGKLLDSLDCFAACHGFGVARACVEDHPPEPERFGRITALLGQDGEVAQGQVAVDALVDATELVGTLSPLATRRFPHIYWPLTTGHWPLFSGRSASSVSRILPSRWSFRYRSAGSV